MHRKRGSVLLLATVLTLTVGALTLTLFNVCFAYHRSSAAGLDHEFALRAAESGANYYVAQRALEEDYFDTNPAPHASKSVGNVTFDLDSAVPGASEGQWDLVLTGTHGDATYRRAAAVGYRRVPMPRGLAVAGTGNSGDTVFELRGGSEVVSYDSASGAFDSNNSGDNAQVMVAGSSDLTGNTTIHGDITATGSVTTDGSAQVTGTVTENGTVTAIEDVDSVVDSVMTSSRAANDNTNLSGVFGAQWSPVRRTTET